MKYFLIAVFSLMFATIVTMFFANRGLKLVIKSQTEKLDEYKKEIEGQLQTLISRELEIEGLHTQNAESHRWRHHYENEYNNLFEYFKGIANIILTEPDGPTLPLKIFKTTEVEVTGNAYDDEYETTRFILPKIEYKERVRRINSDRRTDAINKRNLEAKEPLTDDEGLLADHLKIHAKNEDRLNKIIKKSGKRKNKKS